MYSTTVNNIPITLTHSHFSDLKFFQTPSENLISIRRHAGRLAGRQTGRQADWQAGRLAGWQAGRLAGRQTGRLAGRQTGRLAGWQARRQAKGPDARWHHVCLHGPEARENRRSWTARRIDGRQAAQEC
jgi:hypothetical protein